MNKFVKFLFVGLTYGFSTQVRADALDGYLGLSGGLIRHMSTSDQLSGNNTRYGARLDFVRIQRNVALDLRLGNGLGYQDLGIAFKLFHHFAFSSSTATGLSLGGGLGGMYSKAGISGTDRTFYELFTPIFARVLFDFGFGMGFFIDAEYSPMLQRQFTSSPLSTTDQTIKNRYFLGAGLAFQAM